MDSFTPYVQLTFCRRRATRRQHPKYRGRLERVVSAPRDIVVSAPSLRSLGIAPMLLDHYILIFLISLLSRAAQTMPGSRPKYEILHSGAYWQTLRRNKAARAARQANVRQAGEDVYNSGQWDGAAVVTFVPGNPTPYTSILYANGVLVPVGPSTSDSHSNSNSAPRSRKHAPRPNPTQRGNNVIRRCQEHEDAELLARLTAPRTTGKRRGETQEREAGQMKR